jgi:hypothetical protein
MRAIPQCWNNFLSRSCNSSDHATSYFPYISNCFSVELHGFKRIISFFRLRSFTHSWPPKIARSLMVHVRVRFRFYQCWGTLSQNLYQNVTGWRVQLPHGT